MFVVGCKSVQFLANESLNMWVGHKILKDFVFVCLKAVFAESEGDNVVLI